MDLEKQVGSVDYIEALKANGVQCDGPARTGHERDGLGCHLLAVEDEGLGFARPTFHELAHNAVQHVCFSLAFHVHQKEMKKIKWSSAR